MGHHYVLKRYPLVSSGLLGTPRISHGGFNEKIPCHGNDYRGVKTFQIGDLGRMGPQKKTNLKAFEILTGWWFGTFFQRGWLKPTSFSKRFHQSPWPPNFRVAAQAAKRPGGDEGQKSPWWPSGAIWFRDPTRRWKLDPIQSGTYPVMFYGVMMVNDG